MWYGAVAVGLDEGGFRVTLVDKGNSICRTVYDIPGDVTVSTSTDCSRR